MTVKFLNYRYIFFFIITKRNENKYTNNNKKKNCITIMKPNKNKKTTRYYLPLIIKDLKTSILDKIEIQSLRCNQFSTIFFFFFFLIFYQSTRIQPTAAINIIIFVCKCSFLKRICIFWVYKLDWGCIV